MFVVNTTERAKRVARDLHKELLKLGVKITWSQAIETTARIYGFGDWNELCLHAGKGTGSPDDFEAGPVEAAARKRQHIAALAPFGLDETQAAAVVDAIRPTARSRQRKAEDLPPPLKALADAARKHVAAGEWRQAQDLATNGLQRAAGAEKAPFVKILEEAAPHSEIAAANLGMAYLMGDAGRKDIVRARKLMESAVYRSSDENVLAHAYKVLGDIAGGQHGTQADPDLAMECWTIAADYGEVGAAFNLALRFRQDGLAAEAAEYYEIGIAAGHAPSMTNLAGMILSGEVHGSPDRMENLYRNAARLGDDIAAEALGYMKQLRTAAAEAGKMRRTAEDGMWSLLRAGVGYDPKAWLDVLQEHGWTIEDANDRAKGEGARLCVAVAADGRRFPVFISGAAYMAGDGNDRLAENLKRGLSKWKDAVLIFSSSASMLIGGDMEKVAVCLGMIKTERKWTDFFLREGGLDEALRQHGMLCEDPDLDVAEEFWSARAHEVAIKAVEWRSKAIDSLMDDDPDEDF